MWVSGNKWNALLRRLDTMSQELDDLTAQVGINNGLIDEAIALLAVLDVPGVDPAALLALTASLVEKDNALVNALSAHTPPV